LLSDKSKELKSCKAYDFRSSQPCHVTQVLSQMYKKSKFLELHNFFH